MKLISAKTSKYMRLTHRYLSFICTGILFVYLISGFLLNHQREFDFMRQKRERVVSYSFEIPQDKKAFSDAAAKQIMFDLECDSSTFKRFSFSKNALNIVGSNQLVIKLESGSGEAVVKEIHRPKFLSALNRLHRNPGTAWAITSDIFLLLMVILIITGLLIIPGKKGLLGLGGVLVVVGILIPLLIYWFTVA